MLACLLYVTLHCLCFPPFVQRKPARAHYSEAQTDSNEFDKPFLPEVNYFFTVTCIQTIQTGIELTLYLYGIDSTYTSDSQVWLPYVVGTHKLSDSSNLFEQLKHVRST